MTMRTRVTLRRGSWEQQAIVDVPAETCRPDDVVSALHQLADAISLTNAADASCGAECGVCCRQLVPVTIPEVGFLQRVAADQPPDRRQQIRQLAARANDALRTNGFEPPEELSGRSRHEARTLGQRWFRLGIPCPFLVEESCSIYEQRPLICREYLVTSPPSACATPGRRLIKRTVSPVSVWSRVTRSAPDHPRWLPMSAALTTDVPAGEPLAGPDQLTRLLVANQE